MSFVSWSWYVFFYRTQCLCFICSFHSSSNIHFFFDFNWTCIKRKMQWMPSTFRCVWYVCVLHVLFHVPDEMISMRHCVSSWWATVEMNAYNNLMWFGQMVFNKASVSSPLFLVFSVLICFVPLSLYLCVCDFYIQFVGTLFTFVFTRRYFLFVRMKCKNSNYVEI